MGLYLNPEMAGIITASSGAIDSPVGMTSAVQITSTTILTNPCSSPETSLPDLLHGVATHHEPIT
jgi:hypothetical protein